MKLKQTLPEQVDFASPELAVACCQWLKETHGFTLAGNVGAHQLINPSFTDVRIRIADKYVVWQTRHSGGGIESFKEFVALMCEEPMKIGEHVVEFKTEGVQVGCTFVPWETVKAIAGRAP